MSSTRKSGVSRLNYIREMDKRPSTMLDGMTVGKRVALGIFLASAGRGGAYLTWFVVLYIVAWVIAKGLDLFDAARGKKPAKKLRR
jgi:hypothetical protein